MSSLDPNWTFCSAGRHVGDCGYHQRWAEERNNGPEEGLELLVDQVACRITGGSPTICKFLQFCAGIIGTHTGGLI